MQVYDDVFVPRLFTPWAELLLDAVEPSSGEDLLDVATGPGTVARLAAVRLGPSGRVTGCDLSPAMLALAVAKPSADGAAPITYVECPAGALHVDDASFDIAVCQQGLQFFPDRVGALRELQRALRPGGRVGVAVWSAISESPFFAAIAEGLGEVIGPEAQRAYEQGPWGLTGADEIEKLFDATDFGGVQVERRTLSVEFEGGAPQLVATLAAASVASQVEALDAERRAALVDAVARAAAPITVNGVVRSETAAHVAVGFAP
jgi:ubiquinone/menaquinone biosynthesis C-methylase UbiE